MSYARCSRQIVEPAVSDTGSIKITSRNEGRVEAEFLRGGLVGGQPPQVDGQPPGGGDGELAVVPPGPGGRVQERLDRFVTGLPADQPPDQLHQRGAHGAIAATIDGALGPTPTSVTSPAAQEPRQP